MGTITATIFKGIINDSVIADATAENIIDVGINLLCLFSGETIPNLGGTAGSKTAYYPSDQHGAIMLSARAIYDGFYKGAETLTTGNVTVSAGDVLGNPTIITTIKEAARQLSEWDVSYG